MSANASTQMTMQTADERDTMKKPHLTLIFLGAIAGAAGLAVAEIPRGWVVAGSAPTDYEFTRDTTTAAGGRSSALIAAKPGAAADHFGTLMQTIDAASYQGSRVRLSAALRTEDALRAQLWMRVDGKEGKVLAFDNMDNRPVTGTTGWKRYEVVLDLPTESKSISYGFFLIEHGKVWADAFQLEKVDSSVPVTSGTTTPPREPVNLDFEQ